MVVDSFEQQTYQTKRSQRTCGSGKKKARTLKLLNASQLLEGARALGDLGGRGGLGLALVECVPAP